LFVTVRIRSWWQARGVYVGADDGDGLSPRTSHPAFVAVAPASFFDEANEFAPFGNDAGHDVLGSLEDWYMTGAEDDDVPAFLVDLLTGYGFPTPVDLWSSDSDVARAWASTGDDGIVDATAQTAIGVAVGQFKIRGHIIPTVRRIGWQAVTLQRVLVEQAALRYPHWKLADEAAAGIDSVARVLTRAPSRSR
jgi:uncharacterized protein YfeS